MNTIRQHIPAFVEIDGGLRSSDFSSIEELKEISWVKKWADDRDFHQFSVSDNYLIAEFRGGRDWWVVGHLSNPETSLPLWSEGIYECLGIDGAHLDIPGNEVYSSCGDNVTLRDGRVLKRAK